MTLTIKQRIEQLLASQGIETAATATLLLDEVKQAIQTNGGQGKELGKYIAQLNAFIKMQNISTGLSWQKLAGGRLAIGHKPGGKLPFDGLKKDGATTIVTLLQESEGAHTIGRAVQQAGLQWLWLPFSASKPHTGELLAKPLALFNQMQQVLNSGGGIYIHCSAGIHRTGMITYGFMRYLGKNQAETLQILRQLRVVTAEQAGEDKLSWGDTFAEINNA